MPAASSSTVGVNLPSPIQSTQALLDTSGTLRDGETSSLRSGSLTTTVTTSSASIAAAPTRCVQLEETCQRVFSSRLELLPSSDCQPSASELQGGKYHRSVYPSLLPATPQTNHHHPLQERSTSIRSSRLSPPNARNFARRPQSSPMLRFKRTPGTSCCLWAPLPTSVTRPRQM